VDVAVPVLDRRGAARSNARPQHRIASERAFEVATKNLIDKFAALPPEKKAEVRAFIESIVSRNESAALRSEPPGEWRRRIEERRERLRREYGLYDSVAAIRELRDSGD
jgi:hypothetical protein